MQPIDEFKLFVSTQQKYIVSAGGVYYIHCEFSEPSQQLLTCVLVL